jgi:type II secretory pathway component PulC
MHSGVAPEEKLLKLIRGQKKQTAAFSARDTYPLPKQTAVSFFTYIRIILVLGLITAAVYLAASLLYPLFSIYAAKGSSQARSDLDVAPVVQTQDAKPYAYYLDAVKKRKVFNVPAVTSLQPLVVASEGPGSNVTKDLSLVGIIAGAVPQAIIEDKKSKKTYYVNTGQYIGEIQIDDIQEGKIVINHNGSRFEMYL